VATLAAPRGLVGLGWLEPIAEPTTPWWEVRRVFRGMRGWLGTP